MAENTAGAGADTSGAGAGARPDGGASSGSTPNPGNADASKGGGETVDYWKGEAKKAFAERDQARNDARTARQAFLDSEEGKSLLAAKTAQEKAAEEAAIKRGEYEKLYGEAKARADKAEAEKRDLEAKYQADIAQRDRTVKQSRARTELEAAYRAAGGVDPETFLTLNASALDKDITVSDDGKTVTGVEEVVKKQLAARPYLFKPTRGVGSVQAAGGSSANANSKGGGGTAERWKEIRNRGRRT